MDVLFIRDLLYPIVDALKKNNSILEKQLDFQKRAHEDYINFQKKSLEINKILEGLSEQNVFLGQKLAKAQEIIEKYKENNNFSEPEGEESGP